MNNLQPTILIVEDEPPLVELISYNLEKAGFQAKIARDGDEAMLAVEEHKPDLVLLDWMLPYVSGIEICRRIRRNPDTRDLPIIILTARGEEDDRIRGLDAGADDYVVKPFSPSELVARVKAVLRRTRPAFDKDQLTYGDIAMDLTTHRVSRAEAPVDLGPTEFRLLRFLMEHPGRVFSREQLLDSVWGHDVYIEPRTVDVHIRRLRKAMNLPGTDDLIRTVRSAGYALDIKDEYA
ncbi:MAG: phosphate regulon transcriptional regulator PhoB [Rhodospirillaceae bacterium]|nr:phosphate regulon transcriptional regulator PhoB [Rhodospirillaceae bacterium]MBT5943963.1 phosphate regulon transcriptional regulator PhoB [Rhodospirillaceae bacterium]MBT6404068.1 phosphate regulon transcriptional regulator PhoB [Rhodospirillaceae bacterium]MBT6536991.1 phosphate regulon transcriptional regulator PhoB [Rhodospirillaceae bacterium]MBT7361306.1 phosphate regulon transcriptional regulator PhoB [Rhodospirillaceae bacterium]